MNRSRQKAIGAAAILAAVACTCGAAGPLGSDPSAARAFLKELIDPVPLRPEVRRRARKLLTDLRSERWAARDAASKELLAIGPKAAPLVRPVAESAHAEAAARAGQLLAAYRARQEGRAAVLNTAVDLLARQKDKAAVDSLVKLLSHADERIRRVSEYAVRRITGEQFGYNAHAPADERRAAAAKWAAWWQARRASFDFAAAARRGRVGGVFCWDPYTSRAFLVGLDGKLIWARKMPKRFCGADVLPNGNILVGTRDENKQTVLAEYDPDDTVVWRTKRLPASGPFRDVTRLSNGNTLAIDLRGHRVVEIDPEGKRIVWEYACGASRVCSAQRLPGGNTLLCSVGGEAREITRAGKVVWRKTGLGNTRDAQRLPNGNLLIVDLARRAVVEMDPSGREVWGWTPPDGRGVGGALRLPDGRTVVQVGGVGFLLVDAAGRDAGRLAIPGDVRVYSCNSCRRQLRPAPAGAERAAQEFQGQIPK